MISLLSKPRAAHGDHSAARCPLCRDELRSQELRSGDCGHCPSCETRYHRECFAEFGGCSTLGCVAYRQPMASPSAQQPRAHARAQVVVSESCASCGEGAASAHLWACPDCEASIHVDCFARHGCGTEHCSNEEPPASTLKRASEKLGEFARRFNLFFLLVVPIGCLALGFPVWIAVVSFIAGILDEENE